MISYTSHMKHQTSNVVTLLLAALLFFPACSDKNEPSNDAASGEQQSVTPAASTVTCEFIPYLNKLVISGAGAMPDYPKNGAPWYANRGSIKTIVISDDITTIGNYAFEGCDMEEITLPSKLTSIGNYAFAGCSSLETIAIPVSVRSFGVGAFCQCSKLLSIEVKGYVTVIPERFCAECSELATVVIPDQVKTIGNRAFYDCKKMTKIQSTASTIYSYDFRLSNSLTKIGDYAFAGCEALTGVYIQFGTSVAVGTHAFEGCTAVVGVNLSNVASLGDAAFVECSSLENVTYGSSIKSIGRRAFYHCTKLTTISSCGGVKSIADSAFCHCTALKTVGGLSTACTTIGDRAFFNCSKLTGFTIPSSVTSIGVSAFEMCTSFVPITIPSGIRRIEEGTFANCSVSSITIPSKVTYIGKNAFQNSEIQNVRCEATTPPTLGDYAFSTKVNRNTRNLTIPSGTKDAYVNSSWSDFFYATRMTTY